MIDGTGQLSCKARNRASSDADGPVKLDRATDPVQVAAGNARSRASRSGSTDAGGELDAEARSDRRATPRRALLATLSLAGLRISEALDLRWRDVGLGAGRLRVADAKADAGVRQVDLLPVREELSTHAPVMYRGEGERERPKIVSEGSDWVLLGTGAGLERLSVDAIPVSSSP